MYFNFHFLSIPQSINIGLEWESSELLLHYTNKEKDKIELQVNTHRKSDVVIFGI